LSTRIRLDLMVEKRGLLPSRARARDAILRGTVRVNGEAAGKPGQLVAETDEIVLDDPAAAYVSRAALKLIAGLDAGGVSVTGRVCLDVGASTGGFTQVLLQRGAAKVYAVDVGHRQLHESLRREPRVVSLEGTDARDLDRTSVPEPVGLLVCDASFVSALKILEGPLGLCAPEADAVVLIKPQFEVGRPHIGKGGIVTDAEAIQAAVGRVEAFFAARGWTRIAIVASPLMGGDGNREQVGVFRRP
jgi:23S rRNA (cytidine1920-2'-O)/16S rRNA (cytidine1409-2'-O)-methyltransferase